MAGKSTISITFKLDGDNKGFKDLANDAEGLRKVISSTVSEAKQLSGKTINFAALATGLDAATRNIGKLQSGLKDLADSYAVQELAETKLATVMTQRMSASDKEIQSIKDLASEQQKLGVIGDEVQLSGAQQVATFLTEASSIETLLPAMNNLLAQQKGVNATSQDAVNIANLMGKAMQGQTSSLRRVGITFNEAEENVMKYGTEEERAAMLAQIITNNVGNMNAELAKTDSGKQAQLSNALGDVKEQIGGLVNGALPFVTIAAQASVALSGVAQLVVGIKTLSTTLYANVTAFAASTAALVKNQAVTLATAAAQKTVAAATTAWTAVQKILNLVLTANPIGLVITAIGALVAAVIYAYNHCETFRNICNKVWDVIKPLANAIMNGLAAAFNWLCEKAKAAWEWLKRILGLGGKKAEVTVDVKTSKAPDLSGLENKYKNAGGSKKTSTGTSKATAQVSEEVKGIYSTYEKEIQELTKKVQTGLDDAAVMAAQDALEKKQKEFADWKIKVGIEVDERDMLKELESGKINALSSNDDRRAAYNAATSEMQGVQSDYSIGLIGADEAIARLEQLNALLVNLGMNPVNIDLSDTAAELAPVADDLEKINGKTDNTGNSIKNVGDAISSMGDAFNAAGEAFELPAFDIMGTIAQAIASVALGYAQASSEAASLGPWGWIAFAATGLATMLSTIASIKSATAFAEGGVVSGPTLALVGEYAGAGNNPEVIAPLNKLRSMLDEGNGGGETEFRIRGRDLYAILNNESNRRSRR